jgi:hypothetical protein
VHAFNGSEPAYEGEANALPASKITNRVDAVNIVRTSAIKKWTREVSMKQKQGWGWRHMCKEFSVKDAYAAQIAKFAGVYE